AFTSGNLARRLQDNARRCGKGAPRPPPEPGGPGPPAAHSAAAPHGRHRRVEGPGLSGAYLISKNRSSSGIITTAATSSSLSLRRFNTSTAQPLATSKAKMRYRIMMTSKVDHPCILDV